jgi:hypothetical protein
VNGPSLKPARVSSTKEEEYETPQKKRKIDTPQSSIWDNWNTNNGWGDDDDEDYQQQQLDNTNKRRDMQSLARRIVLNPADSSLQLRGLSELIPEIEHTPVESTSAINLNRQQAKAVVESFLANEDAGGDILYTSGNRALLRVRPGSKAYQDAIKAGESPPNYIDVTPGVNALKQLVAHTTPQQLQRIVNTPRHMEITEVVDDNDEHDGANEPIDPHSPVGVRTRAKAKQLFENLDQMRESASSVITKPKTGRKKTTATTTTTTITKRRKPRTQNQETDLQHDGDDSE